MYPCNTNWMPSENYQKKRKGKFDFYLPWNRCNRFCPCQMFGKRDRKILRRFRSGRTFCTCRRIWQELVCHWDNLAAIRQQKNSWLQGSHRKSIWTLYTHRNFLALERRPLFGLPQNKFFFCPQPFEEMKFWRSASKSPFILTDGRFRRVPVKVFPLRIYEFDFSSRKLDVPRSLRHAADLLVN